MADRTGIEWTDSTFNPWMGCTKISPACDHCYAADSRAVHALGIQWGAGQPRRRTSVANWTQPRRWNDQAFAECRTCGWRGEMRECRSVPHPDDLTPVRGCPTCNSPCVWPARRRVFCASLADVFDNEVDITWLADLLDLIRLTPNLDWLILTKRIGNAGRIVDAALAVAATNDPLRAWIVDWWSNRKPPANVWLGATICNQAEADRDIPKLLATTASVRFLSMEPLLGPVDLRWFLSKNVWEGGKPVRGEDYGHGTKLDWVIAGGESGPSARPMHPAWVRSLRDQCATAGVAYLFKQWGAFHLTEIRRSGEMSPPFPLGADLARAQLATPGSDLFLQIPGSTPAGEVFKPGNVLAVPGGKKATGRMLDGVEHNGYPEVAR